jgi:hypothetical protein
MIDQADEHGRQDYSCEIISFVVLIGLSALSHFWFIAIGIAIGISAWAFISLIKRLMSCAARTRTVQAREVPITQSEALPGPIWKSGISTTQNTPEPGLLEMRVPNTMCAMSRSRAANE